MLLWPVVRPRYGVTPPGTQRPEGRVSAIVFYDGGIVVKKQLIQLDELCR